LRDAVGSVARTVPGGQVWYGLACDHLRLVGLKLIFLVVIRAVSVLGPVAAGCVVEGGFPG
jgi:hypothetical protein